MSRVFLDTETTGLVPGQIGQLAMIKESDNGDLSAHNYFFEVECVEDGAAKVTGRNADFYASASGHTKFSQYADEIISVLSDNTLIAHNFSFDEKFLSAEFWRAEKTFIPSSKFDTMEYFTEICKIPKKYKSKRGIGEYKYPKLEEIVEFLGIDTTKIAAYAKQLFGTDSGDFHDARYDTTAMFVAFHIQKDVLSNSTAWIDVFCKR